MMIQNYEILVWDGKRSKGTKVHSAATDHSGRMLCGYACSERTVFQRTEAEVGCYTCAKIAETLLCSRKAVRV